MSQLEKEKIVSVEAESFGGTAKERGVQVTVETNHGHRGIVIILANPRQDIEKMVEQIQVMGIQAVTGECPFKQVLIDNRLLECFHKEKNEKWKIYRNKMFYLKMCPNKPK